MLDFHICYFLSKMFLQNKLVLHNWFWDLIPSPCSCDRRFGFFPKFILLKTDVASFFASMLSKKLFELQNEEAIKKSENLRDTCPC